MASYSYTFNSGDTVTPTRINDARTISDIVNADIKSDAAIAGSKLADGAITNAKVDASAAIAGTKIAPAFGAQDITVSTANRSITNTGNFALSFGTNNTTRVTIPAAGGISIDTGAPDRIGVALSNNAVSTLDFGSPNSGAGNFQLRYDRNGGIFAFLGGTTGSQTERMRIDVNGSLGIGTNSPTYRLDVSGDSNTSGVFRVGGTQVMTSRRTGWAAPTGTATRTTFATSTVTTAQLAERVKALIDDLTTHGLIGS
jgi:hypothetical protein